MTLIRTTLLSWTNSLVCNFRKLRENWTSEPKSITKKVPQPKRRLASKSFCVHFYTVDPPKKSWDKYFFIRTIFLELLVASDLWDPKTQILAIFTKILNFFAKTTYFSKKILETNFKNNGSLLAVFFLLKWVVFAKKMWFFGKNGQNWRFDDLVKKCLSQLIFSKVQRKEMLTKDFW